MRKLVLLTAAALMLGGLTLNMQQAKAGETGLAKIHILGYERGRLCQSYHYHSRSGRGYTKRAALRNAIRRWQSFTAWEYGSDWARFRLAHSKSKKCTYNGYRRWSCTVWARPCRIRRR